MPTASEIKSKARSISDVKEDIGRESNRLHGQVDHSSTWWQGEAGKSFRSGHNEIRTELTALMNKMDRLYASTLRLSDKVQQADDERKAKAAAAARAAAEQKRLASATKR